MFKIDINGPFYKFLSKVSNYLILGVMWVFASLPLITIGAATTALYSANHKVNQNGNGYIWRTFWAEFRSNFKQATLMWLLMLLILAFLVVDCYFAYILSTSSVMSILCIALLVITVLCVMWMQFWFPYISHIEDPIKVVLKNTLIMCFAHLRYSLWLLAVFAVCIVLFVCIPLSPITIVGVPILYAIFSYKPLFRVFINYWDMDDEHEEAALEEAEEESV